MVETSKKGMLCTRHLSFDPWRILRRPAAIGSSRTAQTYLKPAASGSHTGQGPRCAKAPTVTASHSKVRRQLRTLPSPCTMGERLDLQVARAWLLLGGYENGRSDSIAANAEYDRAGVLVSGSGGPASAPERTAPLPAGGAGSRTGLPPSRVPSYEEVVNRGPASPGSWVFRAETCRSPDTAPMMRFVYWDQDSDTWRRFAACPDCF